MKRHSIFVQIFDYRNIFSSKNIIDPNIFDDYRVVVSYESSYNQCGEFIFSKEKNSHYMVLCLDEDVYFCVQSAGYVCHNQKFQFQFVNTEFKKGANQYGIILLMLILK